MSHLFICASFCVRFPSSADLFNKPDMSKGGIWFELRPLQRSLICPVVRCIGLLQHSLIVNLRSTVSGKIANGRYATVTVCSRVEGTLALETPRTHLEFDISFNPEAKGRLSALPCYQLGTVSFRCTAQSKYLDLLGSFVAWLIAAHRCHVRQASWELVCSGMGCEADLRLCCLIESAS